MPLTTTIKGYIVSLYTVEDINPETFTDSVWYSKTEGTCFYVSKHDSFKVILHLVATGLINEYVFNQNGMSIEQSHVRYTMICNEIATWLYTQSYKDRVFEERTGHLYTTHSMPQEN